MKKLWIAMFALVLAIPVFPTMASGGTMHTQYGWQIGNFNYTGGVAQGKFVNFKIDQDTGEIANYTVNGTMVFNSVTYENETHGDVWTRGATLLYYGMGEKINMSNPKIGPKMNFMWRFINAHDNPAGVMHIVVYGKDTITYTLGNGIQVENEREHLIVLNGTVRGVLLFTGIASVNGTHISIKLGTKNYTFGDYEVYGGSVIFIRTGGWHIPRRIRNLVINAIQQGKMGGEMDINERTSDFVNYTYGMHATLKQRSRNHIQVEVSSENSEGKVIMLNVDKNTLNYDSNHKIVVTLDGKEVKESSENDVFAGGSNGKYTVVDNGNSVTVLVYVPHFSSHTLNVESEPKTTAPMEILMGNTMFLLAMGIVVILIIAGIIILIKRR